MEVGAMAAVACTEAPGLGDAAQTVADTARSPGEATLDTAPAKAAAQSSLEAAASAFECNVCLELASDPVVTLCGHLYCWPCLYRCVACPGLLRCWAPHPMWCGLDTSLLAPAPRPDPPPGATRWMALHPTCKTCPVCKAGVEESKVRRTGCRGPARGTLLSHVLPFCRPAPQVVPLYGRGSTHGDPRKVPVAGLVVPNRPVGQRLPVQVRSHPSQFPTRSAKTQAMLPP